MCIVSYRDSKFVLRFWMTLQEVLDSNLNFITVYHLQTDGNMLRACILHFESQWDEGLLLCEFAYNNSFHSSIGMHQYEALNDSCCRTLVCWKEVGVRSFYEPSAVGESSEKVKLIQERLKIA